MSARGHLHEVARAAGRQHGVISRRQLREAGLSDREIAHRVKGGLLHRLHRGVYGVGHRPSSFVARCMAAVLACGNDAVLCGRSAAALWKFRPVPRGPIEVLAPTAHRHPGIVSRRTRHLPNAERTRHWGVPLTTPARTLIDLAHVLSDRELERAVNQAIVQRRISEEALAEALQRSPGRRALGRLSALLGLGGPTRSELEDEFRSFCLEFALDLQAEGIRVIDVTSRRLRAKPRREALRFRRLLARP